MGSFTLSGLKQDAARRLRQASGSTKKLVLLHVGVLALVSLIVAALDLLLANQIAATGGLSGMGTRTILQTIRSTLSVLVSLITPFWSAGFLWAALAVARGKRADPPMLGEGLRQLLPLLRLLLLEGILCGFLAMLAFYAAVMIAAMTPLARGYLELIESAGPTTAEQLYALLEDPATLEALYRALIPVTVVGGIAGLAAAIYKSYQFRLATYLLLDTDSRKAAVAIRCSRFLMRGHRLALLKLDLSYWWYYLGLGIITSLCYVNPILRLAGITLPLSPELVYLVGYGVYWVLLLGLEYLAKDRVQVTYALFYDGLKPAQPEAGEERG